QRRTARRDHGLGLHALRAALPHQGRPTQLGCRGGRAAAGVCEPATTPLPVRSLTPACGTTAMAKLRLHRSETSADQLPMVCMASGHPAETHIRKKFSYVPGWVFLLLLVNVLICLIVYIILLKSMRVEAPMCHAHRNYWRKRTLWLLLPFLAFVALFIGG